MTTYPHPHTNRLHLHRPRVNPWLVSAVLAAALIGLSTWVIVDRTSGGGGTASDAAGLIDNFNAAVNRNDAKAIAALLTSRAVLYQRGDSVAGANTIGKVIAGQAGTKNLKRIAPVAINGEYATTFIHFSALGGVEDWPQLEVFQIKDGKLARIWGFLLGETPPFENIARS
jgi:hypothetical protein